MTNLDSIFKSRDITLLIKFHLIKAMVFPAVKYRCEGCTIKKAEHWRIDAFVLWCWRRFLRVSWIARRSNQSILKGINPEYSLEGLMLKLKFQYFGHLMQRTDSLEKTLMLGKIQGRRRRGQQRMRWLDGITDSMDIFWVNSRSWWWTGKPGMLQSMGLQSQAWLSNRTELNWLLYDVAIPPLGEFKARCQRNMCIPMFIAVLFAIVSGGNPRVHQQKNDKQTVVYT